MTADCDGYSQSSFIRNRVMNNISVSFDRRQIEMVLQFFNGDKPSSESNQNCFSKLEECVNDTSVTSPSESVVSLTMKKQPPLLFADDEVISDTRPPQRVTSDLEAKKASHALQDDRSRPLTTTPLIASGARRQQLFAFDDGPDRNHSQRNPSPDIRTVDTAEQRSIHHSDQKSGNGDRNQSSTGIAVRYETERSHFASPERNGQPTSFLKHRGHQPLFEGLNEDDTKPIAVATISTVAPNHPQRTRPVDSIASDEHRPSQVVSTGDKSKARDIINAVRCINELESQSRMPTDGEREILRKFCGFGPVALSLFPDPLTNCYKDSSWQVLGEELKSLLSYEDYESAKRTTFNAFYTSPDVMRAMHAALNQQVQHPSPTILEPGCGIGNFVAHGAPNQRFIGVELDRTSGRIARALYPQHDIRVENFRDTKLMDNSLDGVIGNVPFANIKLDHKGQRFSLHDYFFAKSLDALKPGGTLALVTSHFTLDKQNASIREYLASQADFLGAIRLPAEAFQQQGTKVVTDIIFLRKRAAGAEAKHADPEWLQTALKHIDGIDAHVNQYFIKHPEMVLGEWTKENQLYGGEGFSIRSKGPLNDKLQAAIARLPVDPTIVPVHDEGEVAPARFTRPPPDRHITEGSFFVGDDRTIYQIEGGIAQPVTHGTTVLKSDGTMMGKRLSALIGLRDAARLVLQSQNEGWPESERKSTRHALTSLYDRFISLYDPINKTTFGETKDGNVIRRMPNLVRFREDPDAMLVMSLEDYDEVTGKAEKTAIFGRDVVGRKSSIETVASAEEGLLVSLDQKGGVDLPFIASLYHKPESEVIKELGDLIYLNPESSDWETADVYLSGNVRHKLAVAEAAGDAFEVNAAKLRMVQPPDVLPGDIDANLGAPWIPESDIKSFACELFKVKPDSINIGHLKKDAVWCLDADYEAEASVAATSEYGTEKANGTVLFEQALNMKTPIIYDTISTPNGEERVVNQAQTLAAREKQKLIKDKFREWVFADPERTERLVRLYNDTYNNLRPRLFDGSHLDFSGMNQTISLRQHQKNAIWRAMSSGNTLLAHAVGAGKTFTMAATGIKLKQAGLVKKPMFVVPNHMLEQFSREFMQLYPNARLLVAGKDDISRERRKYLTAKIASGEWDGIIVTHSSFEKIGMSTEYQERFLREQIQEYDQLLTETRSSESGRKHRNLIKTIEKQKANRENRLKELLAEEKKDDGLVFDELGVDHIFIDEAHYFKNLETPTKMERVAGIQTGGSQRAFDIFMKARYLDEQHAGHGVTFATGTPISNTMVEMYNLQRFLDPRGLADRGIEHFDAWAANFGEVVESMEISPDGASLRPRSRFAKFNNLPELQQMFRSFADVQTSDMLDLPRPTLKGGKPVTVSCPMTVSQSLLQAELIERYDRIRSQKVDPRVDNALAITTDGRKLALDARMIDAAASDVPDSKINALVSNVVDIWNSSASNRGTQLIFCDMGVHPTSWGFSAYDTIVNKLIARGIPRDQIATVGDADTDAKKQVLFEKVRNGIVRIVLGSTQKMGTGTNVQKRLIAMHHLDAPWKPAEVEQRDGRILRQGNLNPEVSIYRYVTEGSFDAYMWQALETKARFISQIITGNASLRRAEDIGGQELSYAEVKAIASGNPAVLTLAEADAELQRLNILRKNHADDQFLIRRKLKDLPTLIDRLTRYSENLQSDLSTMKTNAYTPMKIGSRSVLSDEAFGVLSEVLERLPENVERRREYSIGEYEGLEFGVVLSPFSVPEVYLRGATTRTTMLSRDHAGARAVLNAIQRIASAYGEAIKSTAKEIAVAEQQLSDYQLRLGQPFKQDAYIQSLTQLRDQLKLALSDRGSEEQATPILSTSEIAEAIKSLRLTNESDDSAKRPSTSVEVSLEEPITTRLKRHLSVETFPNKETLVPKSFSRTGEMSRPSDDEGINDGIQHKNVTHTHRLVNRTQSGMIKI